MLVAVPVDGLDAVRPRHGLLREVRGQLLAAVFLGVCFVYVCNVCRYVRSISSFFVGGGEALFQARVYTYIHLEPSKHIPTHPCLLETKTRTFPAPTMPPRCLLSQPHFSESSYFDCG